jgi:hypothetical protein
MKDEATKQVIGRGIDLIEDMISYGEAVPRDELHHRLYNEDYFIIGYYQAEEFLKHYGVFNAIELIKQYENDNFGEVNTDFSSSETVANMFAYIIGETALQDCNSYNMAEDDDLSVETLKAIKAELEAQL